MVTVLRPGQKVYQIPGYGMTMRETGVAVAASAGWWEVSGKTCLAAYQPKGAASYAASKVNLANPGTYDCTEGDAPSWASATGWTFSGSNILSTGITVASTDWTIAVHMNVTGQGGGSAGRAWVAGSCFLIPAYMSVRWYRWTDSQQPAGNMSGISNAIVAGADAYYQGVHDADFASSGAIAALLYLGNRTEQDRALGGSILSVATYSDTLTPDESAALVTAMAAL